MSRVLSYPSRVLPTSRGCRVYLLAGFLALLFSIAPPCYAAHWQVIGRSIGDTPGMSYIDLDSVREEEGYRVALFLTIYASAMPNAHKIKIDRISQETAFDCTRRQFALRSTVGYFEGKQVGLSSDQGDWKARFRELPKDTFSQRVLDMACNLPLAPQPEARPSAADAPGSVRLPGPGGVGAQPPPSNQ
jgi:hypothetical protein